MKKERRVNMFGMNGFGNPGDLMFLQSIVENEEEDTSSYLTSLEEVVQYATEAFAQKWGKDLERCIDYGYETAGVWPEDFTDEENERIEDLIKERYDDYFA